MPRVEGTVCAMKPALIAASLLALILASPAATQEAEPPTPKSVVDAALASDWRRIDPADLVVMDLAPDANGKPRRVIIQLVPHPFSQGWTDNIRKLAKAHFWDGLGVYRVVDNWVAQWGDLAETRPLPDGLNTMTPDDFVIHVERDPQEDRDFIRTPEKEDIVVSRYLDSYAIPAFVAGWPIGLDQQGGETAWPVHCYGTVGVARSIEDMGSGSELYAVIGHAPRQLDRIIAVVGRVIEGIEYLSVLPRGTGDAGLYETEKEQVPILKVRMGDDLGDETAPQFEYLHTKSRSFARYLDVRANRSDAFYIAPANGIDLCNAPVPIRHVTDR
jgi:peptidylprolyl isomerase